MTTSQVKKYPIDVTGLSHNNRVENERHDITPTKRVIIPNAGKFYEEGFSADAVGRPLTKGTDYRLIDLDDELTRKTGKAIFTAVEFTNNRMMVTIALNYQCYGSREYSLEYINELKRKLQDKGAVIYDNIFNRPDTFPPEQHRHHTRDVDNWYGVVNSLNGIGQMIASSRHHLSSSLYLSVQQLISNMSRKMDDVRRDIEETLRLRGELNQLTSRVDDELARLQREIAAMSDYERFNTLVNERIDAVNLTISGLRREIREELTQRDTTTSQTITTKIAEAKQEIESIFSNRIDELDNTYITHDELNNRLSIYTTQRDIESIRQDLMERLSRSEFDDRVNQIKREIDYHNLRNRPRVFTHIDEGLEVLTGPTSRTSNIIEGYHITEDTYTEIITTHRRRSSAGLDKSFWVNQYNHLNLLPDVLYGHLNTRNQVDMVKMTPYMVVRYDSDHHHAERALTSGAYHLNSRYYSFLVEKNNTDTIGLVFRDDKEVSVVTRTRTVDGVSYDEDVRLATMDDLNALSNKMTERINNMDANDVVNEALRGLDNHQSIIQLNQALANRVPLASIQENETDYQQDKIPKFFPGGKLALRKLSFGNNVEVNTIGSELNINAVVRMPNFILTSDARLKEDITPIRDVKNVLKHIRGYQYRLKGIDDIQIGVLAQEVQKVIPHAVKQDDDGYLSVYYTMLIPYLIEALNEANEDNRQLKERIGELEQKMEGILNGNIQLPNNES